MHVLHIDVLNICSCYKLNSFHIHNRWIIFRFICTLVLYLNFGEANVSLVTKFSYIITSKIVFCYISGWRTCLFLKLFSNNEQQSTIWSTCKEIFRYYSKNFLCLMNYWLKILWMTFSCMPPNSLSLFAFFINPFHHSKCSL